MIDFLVALALSSSTVAAPAASTELMKAAQTLQAAQAAADADRCADAIRLSEQVVDAQSASTLPPTLRVGGHFIAAFCASRLQHTDDAYRHAVVGTAIGRGDPFLWRYKVGVEVQREQISTALATIEAMGRNYPLAIATVPVSWLYQLDNRLRDTGDSAGRRRLLDIVTNSSIRDDPFMTVDGFRQRLAGLLYDQNDRAGAAALVRQIENSSILLSLSLDMRFREQLPPNFDLRASVEVALKRSQALVKRYPDYLRPVIDTATYLRVLGRPADANATLEAVRERVTTLKDFRDRNEWAIWWWNGLSNGSWMLGRIDDAATALRGGVAETERGRANVSQTINLSDLQLMAGRPADALATLLVFDGKSYEASNYGLMQVAMDRGCANFMLGKMDAVATDMAFAKAHVKDAPSAYTRLLLCTGNLDDAAASLIDRLKDKDQRIEALRELSDFDPLPVAPPRHPIDVNLAKVKLRSDIQAAILEAGGVRRFNIQDQSF